MPSRDENGKRLPGNRQRKRARQRAEMIEATPEGRALDDESFVDAARDLGPPPEDPIEAIVWGNRLAALTAWACAVGPLSIPASSRRKGVLEAIKALGMTNAKAVDKKVMLQIAERLGLKAKDVDGDLELVGEGTKALRA